MMPALMTTITEYRNWIFENAAFWGHSPPPCDQDIRDSWDRELARREFRIANDKLLTALYGT